LIVLNQLESNDSQFYPTTYVEVIDNTAGNLCDDNAKLEVYVVSDKFEKVPLLQRHRMINDTLSECMPQIHALTIKAWTTEQYKSKFQR
jgi:stress-induced morphogen